MSDAATDFWRPSQYLLFEDLRSRPASELLARVEHTLRLGGVDAAAVRRAVDLGCGTGAQALQLATRFPNAAVRGVDSSASMLQRARQTWEQLSDESIKQRVEWQQAEFQEFNESVSRTAA